MSGDISFSFSNEPRRLRAKSIGVFALLAALNPAAWAWALTVFHAQPVLLGLAFVAYTFGLRHAVDADHIAAIDNVTRKLMQQGQRPVTVGLFFAFGHSAVVIGLSVAIAFGASAAAGSFEALRATTDVLSTLISAFYLFAIALVNAVVFISVWRTFQSVKRGAPFVEQDFDILLNSRGVLARLFRPLFRMVTKSWHMLLVGFLFALGFDTATEVGMFGISAAQGAAGHSFGTIFGLLAVWSGSTAGSLVETHSCPSISWQRKMSTARSLSRPKPPEAVAEGQPLQGSSHRRR